MRQNLNIIIRQTIVGVQVTFTTWNFFNIQLYMHLHGSFLQMSPPQKYGHLGNQSRIFEKAAQHVS